MEMPFIGRLQTDYRSVLAIVGAVCSDDVYALEVMIVDVVAQHLADFFAAALFAFLAGADV